MKWTLGSYHESIFTMHLLRLVPVPPLFFEGQTPSSPAHLCGVQVCCDNACNCAADDDLTHELSHIATETCKTFL